MRNALFAPDEVETWLEQHRKGSDVSEEVLLWQLLRGSYRDDMVRGLTDICRMFISGCSEMPDPEIAEVAYSLAGQSSPAEVVAALTERFVDSSSRVGSEQVSTRRLVRAVGEFAGPVDGTVFDPTCGIGSLLLGLVTDTSVTLAGQEINLSVARLAEARAELAGHRDVTIRVGDSLRDDRWPGLRADLVVCDPPMNLPDWGRDDLLLDTRWELGLPTRGESELAWLQHCYAHAEPGGKVIMVMPASVAYRKAGRRIRAELVRRGILTQIVALPPGMAVSHAQPVHLWMLTRPSAHEGVTTAVRMVDLTANDPDESFEPEPHQVEDVPLIDLLDEAVDLTPAHHIAKRTTDHLAEYLAVRETLLSGLRQLSDTLPPLALGPGSLDGAAVRIADLARAKLVEVSDAGVTSTTDQLDTDYLRGFAASTANARRSTSSSGSYRVDTRIARVPQMEIADQRHYGDAFRSLDEFERRVRELTSLSEQAIALARDGLTSGTLRPDQLGTKGLGAPLHET